MGPVIQRITCLTKEFIMNKALSLFENPRFNFLTDSFIGFDDMFRSMDDILSSTSKMETFPPYDIYTEDVDVGGKDESIKQTHTFIKFAIAGIKKDDIAVEFRDNVLRVFTEYKKDVDVVKDMEKHNRKYVRKGIAERSFSITKTIDKSLELVGAKYEDGCLIIEFQPRIVEGAESSRIEIK